MKTQIKVGDQVHLDAEPSYKGEVERIVSGRWIVLKNWLNGCITGFSIERWIKDNTPLNNL